MLKQRLLTALILIPLVLAAILLLPSLPFQLLIGAVVLAAGWEWSRLIQLQGNAARAAFVLLLALLMLAVGWAGGVVITSPLLQLTALFWLLMLLWVFVYPAGFPAGQRIVGRGVVVGVLVLLPLWIAGCGLQALAPRGGWMTIFVLLLIWAADTGAYTFGRLFGRHKLAPKVSPGKTWEGAGGALVGAAIIVVPALIWQPFAVIQAQPLLFVLLCVATVLLSIVGDLLESMFKRHSGIKDSGTIFPGHGGLLDRIDSLAAALPVFAAGVALLGAL